MNNISNNILPQKKISKMHWEVSEVQIQIGGRLG